MPPAQLPYQHSLSTSEYSGTLLFNFNGISYAYCAPLVELHLSRQNHNLHNETTLKLLSSWLELPVLGVCLLLALQVIYLPQPSQGDHYQAATFLVGVACAGSAPAPGPAGDMPSTRGAAEGTFSFTVFSTRFKAKGKEGKSRQPKGRALKGRFS
eukprot:1159416-Pelagomonas_calceolata.AAC.13